MINLQTCRRQNYWMILAIDRFRSQVAYMNRCAEEHGQPSFGMPSLN